MGSRKKVDQGFFTIWSADMAYVLGFFFADGTFDISPRGAYYFGFNICDKVLLYSIRKSLGSEHKIAHRKRNPNNAIQYRIQIGSKRMCSDLTEIHGVQSGKAKRMELQQIPKEYFPHFVRGYFDGDGHVWSGYINKHRKKPVHILMVGFTSCSKNFLQNLYDQLKEYGLDKGGVYCKDTAFCIKYGTADSIRLYEIMYGQLGESKLFLSRKKKRFEKYIEMRKLRV